MNPRLTRQAAKQAGNPFSSTANPAAGSTAEATGVPQPPFVTLADVEHNVADPEQAPPAAQDTMGDDDIDKELAKQVELALADENDIETIDDSDDDFRNDQSEADSPASVNPHSDTADKTTAKTAKKVSRYAERAKLIQLNNTPAWDVYRQLDIDAINLSIFDSPSGKAHLMVDKETAVKRAIIETEGHDDLFRAVLSDIDEFQESTSGDTFAGHGKIRSMQNALTKAVTNYRSRKPFERDLPSKSMLLAARYCESSCTLNATIAGKLAHLNHLDLAQVESRSNAQPDNSALSSIVVDLQATVNELQRKVNTDLVTKANLTAAIQASSITVVNAVCKDVAKAKKGFEDRAKQPKLPRSPEASRALTATPTVKRRRVDP
ncbi:hypothetical protein F4781DRAFT_61145 [Annulohypoxylon bovei var. microspora]|nr:hypothetical protein F4781DRAFT_61145 [Annulohypoxylon bovei var. microspora]